MAPTSIRLSKELEEKVRALANEERRTFSNMLAVLVELGLDVKEVVVAGESLIGVSKESGAEPSSARSVDAAPDDYPHFKPDFK